ncbi:hypothetical protein ADUPG1_011712 [Aduncisulcus paluster]|uniref:Uncharacterized protein n=1 Tax=Aduncisulcus paluster TaxID=2918883 RepID=A0ABQ5JWY5_9EUKA|nr:hypothetical protein ADUPG1_011712 [Aduncisulcus paluster]
MRQFNTRKSIRDFKGRLPESYYVFTDNLFYSFSSARIQRTSNVHYALSSLSPPIFRCQQNEVHEYTIEYNEGVKLLKYIRSIPGNVLKVSDIIHDGTPSVTTIPQVEPLSDDFGGGAEDDISTIRMQRSYIHECQIACDELTYAEKVEKISQSISSIRCSREDKRVLVGTLQRTFTPTLSARCVTDLPSSIISFTQNESISTYGTLVKTVSFKLRDILSHMLSQYHANLTSHISFTETSSWREGTQPLGDGCFPIGIMTFTDDMPLTGMAYNPVQVTSITIVNFSPFFRSRLQSRYLLSLRPGGKVSDKTRVIERYIINELRETNGSLLWHGGRKEYVHVGLFHFCHKADSPQRHEHLDIPKPGGLCRKKCSICDVPRDQLKVIDRSHQKRTDITNPFHTPPLPSDLLHMEGRTMSKVLIPMYVKEFQQKGVFDRVCKLLSDYRCGKNISLLHSISFTAHQFYELCYVLPALCSMYHIDEKLIKAATYRAEYQYLIMKNYSEWIDEKETVIDRIVDLLKKHRKVLLQFNPDRIATCLFVHMFPSHFKEMCKVSTSFDLLQNR